MSTAVLSIDGPVYIWILIPACIFGGVWAFLTYQAEDANPGHGHVIVRTRTLHAMAPLIGRVKAFAARALPDGEVRAERLAFGPGGGNPVEIRFSGSDPGGAARAGRSGHRPADRRLGRYRQPARRLARDGARAAPGLCR